MKPLCRFIPAVALIGVVFVGCSSDDPRPLSSELPSAALSRAAEPGRYPLEIGNKWTYASDFVAGGDFSYRVHSTIVDEIVGTEQRSGREYVLMRETITEDVGSDPLVYWIRTRQDRAGLYEADIPLNEPPLEALTRQDRAVTSKTPFGVARFDVSSELPASAIASPALRTAWRQMQLKLHYADIAVHRFRMTGMDPSPPGEHGSDELMRLQYPLHTGASWDVRDEPFTVHWTVEGPELLDLPIGKTPAWRVRGEMSLFGPSDRLYLWYGKDGDLGHFLHAVSTATDSEGNEIGTFVTDTTQKLAAVSLVKR